MAKGTRIMTTGTRQETLTSDDLEMSNKYLSSNIIYTGTLPYRCGVSLSCVLSNFFFRFAPLDFLSMDVDQLHTADIPGTLCIATDLQLAFSF